MVGLKAGFSFFINALWDLYSLHVQLARVAN